VFLCACLASNSAICPVGYTTKALFGSSQLPYESAQSSDAPLRSVENLCDRNLSPAVNGDALTHAVGEPVTYGSEQRDLRQALSKQQAACVAANLKRRLLDAPHELRKRYVHGLVSEIVVSRDKAVISGPSAAIAAAVSAPERMDVVRTFVREWRTVSG
jgi:hypothetical protein